MRRSVSLFPYGGERRETRTPAAVSPPEPFTGVRTPASSIGVRGAGCNP